jgi:DNA mismatch repair ATPase MutS
MVTHDIQRVLRARYGGVEASDVLVQFARIELERPDALVWMQNGKFFEVYGDVARLLGRLLDLRVAEKPLMTSRSGQLLLNFGDTTAAVLHCEASEYLPNVDEIGSSG